MNVTELDIHNAKLQLIGLAKARNLDSGVLVAAMADVMGLCAATLEKHRAEEVNIDAMLDEVITRAKAAFQRTRTSMILTQATGVSG